MPVHTSRRRRRVEYSSFKEAVDTSRGALEVGGLGENLGEEARNALLREKTKNNSDPSIVSPRQSDTNVVSSCASSCLTLLFALMYVVRLILWHGYSLVACVYCGVEDASERMIEEERSERQTLSKAECRETQQARSALNSCQRRF